MEPIKSESTDDGFMAIRSWIFQAAILIIFVLKLTFSRSALKMKGRALYRAAFYLCAPSLEWLGALIYNYSFLLTTFSFNYPN